ncbi:TMV resistance protein N [Trifolium repens]|nr:TMV resistance protein N [Trifolium repens]
MAVSATSSSLSYDVFISFRGEDTRLGFTGFLYETLSDRGIRTFFDHHAAEEPIKAIEESKVSIIVFSENYASSTYCLDELVSIIESYTKNNNKKKDNNHCRLVFPVFYHVDPSHVRNQSGVYAQAMNVHKENSFDSEKLMKWKDALNQAANFSGCHFKHGDGYEYELIERIVDVVSSKIDSTPYLRVADHPVGLNYRVLEVNWLLNDHDAGSHGAGLKIPSKDIQTILKQTYDALDQDLRQIFLDITCFFKGYELSEVEYLLRAHHGYCLEPHHFGVLLQKSLIKFDAHNRVKMHDLIQDMGREIVRQESPNNPGKRSRLWFTKDIVEVLEKDTGTSEIQTIILDFPKYEKVVQWDGKAFKKMKGLQTLIIRSLCFAEGPKNLPNSLRVLEWWGYPSQFLPSDFYPEKLAVLKLPHSSFMSPELSKSKKFVNMTLLNFDECKFITHIPDVSGAPNLERLSLVCCKLQNFPPIQLTSLQHLNLSHCSSLVSFPEILGNMKNITSLSLEDTAIREFPYSIGNIPRLKRLELHGCGKLLLPSSIILLSELEELSIWQCEGLQSYKQDRSVEKLMVASNVKHIDFLSCNISEEFIRIGLAWFSNVVELNLSANNFTILPACIKDCHLLAILILDYCMHLREIGGIPPNLETFSAIRCTSLKELDLTDLLTSTKVCCSLRELVLDDCENL